MIENSTKVLEEANTLFLEKEYCSSLQKYLWCFENAEKEDEIWKKAKLGACLEGWYELSKKYEPALVSLVNKKDSLIKVLKLEKSVDKFLEYTKISAKLNLDSEVITLFKLWDKEDKNFAQEIYNLIFETLVKNEEWGLCEKYLVNSEEKYVEILNLFDELMKISNEMYKGEYNSIYQNKFIQDIENLIHILKYGKRYKEVENINKKLKVDLVSRGGNLI